MLGSLSVALAVAMTAQNPRGAATLESGFRHPPVLAQPHTWWHWMGGNASKEGITADLEAMKQAGIGGAHIFDAGQGIPAGPIAYNSPAWRDLMAFAMEEAGRLGLEMTMHNCSGWSSSGGPWVKPEDAMKKVTFRTEVFEGPGVAPTVPEPPTVGGYYRDIATFAVPSVEGAFNRDRQSSLTGLAGNPGVSDELNWPVAGIGRIVNLTKRGDRRLGQGRWIVLRMGYTLTGARNVASRDSGEGLEVDKLSAESLDRYLEGALLPLVKRIGDPVGKSFTTVLIDSYETGFQNWTPKMVEDFKRLRGYDPTPFLPTLAGFAVDDEKTTLKFLFDFRRTLADLWAENYSGHFAKRLGEFGLQLAVEPYGNGNFDPFTYAKPAGLIMGEYWVGEGTINGSVKMSSSVAHLYGRKVVGAEALTASQEQAGWRNQPRQWKPFADRGYTTGINRIIYHRFAHQPWAQGVLPGMTMGPWGSHVDRTNTFWSFMKQWDEYLARCQFMLQSGRFYGDVLLFAGEGMPQQYIGENQALPDVPEGYGFDFCGVDPLMSLSVKGGQIALPNGATYRLLALPNMDKMSLATLKKIRSLVRAGAVVVGPRPTASPSLADGPTGDAEVAKLASSIWGVGPSGVRSFGKGQVFWGMTVAQALKRLQVAPDFTTRSRRVSAIHRRIGETDAYFVASMQPNPHRATCGFRVAGRVPELWHPESGTIEDAPIWRTTRTGVEVDIPLESDGSVFVVFRRPIAGEPHVASVVATPADRVGQPAKTLRILRAEYGALGQPGKTMDVTRVLSSLVQDGSLQITASNGEMGGDPAYNIVKSLRVEYEFGGETRTVEVRENEQLTIGDAPYPGAPPLYEVGSSPGGPTLRVWQSGRYSVKLSTGKTVALEPRGLPAPLEVGGPWDVRFPEGWDAPSLVTLDKLVSWTEHEDFGVRHFSGTATYAKRLKIPAEFLRAGLRLVLDLGDVRELARIRVNGKLVASIWKPPFRVDVTDVAQPGDNVLQVEVTNLWTNRLIGDEQFPDDMGWDGQRLRDWPAWFVQGKPRPEPRRKTFTTWRHNTKDTPLLPSGILGPVILRPVAVLKIR